MKLKTNIEEFNIENIVKEYMESNLQYGHKPKEWNPKMAPYIHDEKSDYHIIDLTQSYSLLTHAANFLTKKAKKAGKFLFVGTSKVSSRLIEKYARESDSHYINYRWLGGMLTNWPTIQKRIKRLKELSLVLNDEDIKNIISKKDYSSLKKEKDKLKKLFAGIESMDKLPDVVIFTSQLKDYLAIDECMKLGIPCVAIADSNCDPDLVPYPIPGNDDSATAVEFVLKKLGEAIIEGNKTKI